jgi:hypothetical protein
MPRPELVARVNGGLEHSPVVLILGPRQCGRTTLAQMLGEKQSGSYYDLESPRDLARLVHPQTILEAGFPWRAQDTQAGAGCSRPTPTGLQALQKSAFGSTRGKCRG